jgi:hypothetical protein
MDGTIISIAILGLTGVTGACIGAMVGLVLRSRPTSPVYN